MEFDRLEPERFEVDQKELDLINLDQIEDGRLVLAPSPSPRSMSLAEGESILVSRE